MTFEEFLDLDVSYKFVTLDNFYREHLYLLNLAECFYDEVEYLGDVTKGSTVEKIEYSNSLRETKVFGVSLMQMKENCLKIHLKKPASEIAKEKKNTEIEKELRSLIESSE